MENKFKKDLKVSSTLTYILKKNNIEFAKEDKEEYEVPEGQQIVCLSPKGKVIFADATDKKSVHYDIADKINPKGNKMKSLMELIKRGFIFFGDISNKDGHCASISYLRGKETKAQKKRLSKIKENGYELIDGALDVEEFDELYSSFDKEETEEMLKAQ